LNGLGPEQATATLRTNEHGMSCRLTLADLGRPRRIRPTPSGSAGRFGGRSWPRSP